MKTTRLGRTALRISEIGFGPLEIGRARGLPIEGDFAIPSESDVQASLDWVLELGLNLIDTAPACMLSEELDRNLARHPKMLEAYGVTPKAQARTLGATTWRD